MVGTRIALQRHKLGITQEQLAQRLHVTPSAVGMYEQERREPSITVLAALSEELGVSLDYLLTGREYANNNTLLSRTISLTDVR